MATKHYAICEADFIWKDCVDGGRADLARKVLELVESRIPQLAAGSPNVMKNQVAAALRELFADEGIDVVDETNAGW